MDGFDLKFVLHEEREKSLYCNVYMKMVWDEHKDMYSGRRHCAKLKATDKIIKSYKPDLIVTVGRGKTSKT